MEPRPYANQLTLKNGSKKSFLGEQKYQDRPALSTGDLELVIYRTNADKWMGAFREVDSEEARWDLIFENASWSALIVPCRGFKNAKSGCSGALRF
jgi:hypothetical protein